ncbi:MAG: DMT family transporter, partial [Pseudomonadota bacterium]
VMSTGLPVIGVLFWQGLLVGLFAFVMALLRGAKFRLNNARLRLVIAIGCLGTLFPGLVAYWAIQHIPAGIMSITIALVPIFVMPIAIALGNERFELVRLLGVLFGAAAILLIVGPEAAMPDHAKIFFVFLALLAPLCYAFEDNYVAYFGRDDMHPFSILTYAMVVVAILSLPFALMRDEFFILGQGGMDQAHWALIVISLFHTIAYATFIWLIGQTGPVFTSFVAYLVTGFGVIWSLVFLGESYSIWVWAALGMMFVAMFLVQPRSQEP